MGQRSQIYVGFLGVEWEKQEPGAYKPVRAGHMLMARYFQDNCAENMISRARHTMEWLQHNAKHIDYPDKQRQLASIMEVDFDTKAVCLSIDCVQEWKEYAQGFPFKDIFTAQDNNNGQLYIDVDVNGNLKYAFVHYERGELDCDKLNYELDYDNVLDAKQYIDIECGYIMPEYQQDVRDRSAENIKWIEENATLMTAEELAQFMDRDFGYRNLEKERAAEEKLETLQQRLNETKDFKEKSNLAKEIKAIQAELKQNNPEKDKSRSDRDEL